VDHFTFQGLTAVWSNESIGTDTAFQPLLYRTRVTDTDTMLRFGLPDTVTGHDHVIQFGLPETVQGDRHVISLKGEADMSNGKINLTTGITSKTSQNWTNFVAQDMGFFEEEGLNHSYAIMKDMREGMDQLIQGKVPIVTAMADTPILEIERGGKIRIIGTVVRTGFGHIVASPECKGIKDLKGKSLAVIDPQSGSTVILREILRRGGLRHGEYEVKHVGGTPRRYEALKMKEVAGAFLSPPYDFQAEAEGYRLLADYAEHFPSYPLAMNVNIEFGRRSPDVVTKYLRAMIKASHWIYDSANRSEAVSILEKNMALPRSFAEKTYDYVIDKIKGISPDCEISLPKLEELTGLMVEAGLLDKKALGDASKFIDRSFLDRAKVVEV
jgi:ABC-type nitrate/sulfonate/bicarbonate transport system substrate-binding protein